VKPIESAERRAGGLKVKLARSSRLTSRCGQQAAFALADMIGNKTVECRPKDRDRYGRVVAVCLAGGKDLNAWMVANGLALAYRQYWTDYVSQEQQAAGSKLGMWRGEFIPPWEWRRGNRR
jgi:endonuclease YncB( thermonuclease family)